MSREYGYAFRGEKVFSRKLGKKYKRTNIVAGKQGKKIIFPLEYDFTMDSTFFEFWFEKCLLPCLEKGTTIVMDNAKFHRKKQLFKISEKFEMNLIFLPPYSPELNPIEKFWSYLKSYIKNNIHLFQSLDDAIFSFFQVF